MSWLSNIAKKAAPVIAQFSPDPATKAIATAYTIETQRRDASYRRKVEEERLEQERKNMAEIFGSGQVGGVQPSFTAPSTQNAGQGGFVSGVTDFFRGAGEVISSAFGSGLPQLFGVGRPRGVQQQPALTTVTNIGAQESQGSGSIQAGMGSLIPSLVSGARGLIKSPVGQLLTGTGAGVGISMLGADGKPMRVTRKMKAQARSLLNMTGGNLALTADFLGISEQQLVFILLKRFRNDGPVVTKAALRKTKSTIRKMKNMCDMYDDLRPAARRRSPMRRKTSTTTLIKN